MYIDEPYVEPHPNFIRKFKPESNLTVAEPEPCDIAYNYPLLEIIMRFSASNISQPLLEFRGLHVQISYKFLLLQSSQSR